MKIRQLTTAGGNTAHITLSLADLAAGETLEVGAENESAAVVLTGRVDAAVDGAPLGGAGGRSCVLDAADAGRAPRPRRPRRRWRAAGRSRRPELRLRGARRHRLRAAWGGHDPHR